MRSKRIASGLCSRASPRCLHAGTLWDLVALYPKGKNWNDSEPLYIDGPVVKVQGELARQTSDLVHR